MPGHNANRGAKDPPSLVPTSSFNKVLLVGGKNLTLFQSVGLLVLALVALGIGVSLLAVRVFWFAMWGSALTLWGFAIQWLQGGRCGPQKKQSFQEDWSAALSQFSCRLSEAHTRNGAANRRNGSVIARNTTSSTPCTAIPTMRNGSRISQTNGYAISATRASGQHITNSKHQRRKANMGDLLAFWINHTAGGAQKFPVKSQSSFARPDSRGRLSPHTNPTSPVGSFTAHFPSDSPY